MTANLAAALAATGLASALSTAALFTATLAALAAAALTREERPASRATARSDDGFEKKFTSSARKIIYLITYLMYEQYGPLHGFLTECDTEPRTP